VLFTSPSQGFKVLSTRSDSVGVQDARQRGEMWVLKQEVHRGKGVHVMPLAKAVEEAKVRKLDQNYDLVQAYVANQLTVLGRKFYIRQGNHPLT
jgi:hypothetical protein